mgnify:CR=1 FL=1
MERIQKIWMLVVKFDWYGGPGFILKIIGLFHFLKRTRRTLQVIFLRKKYLMSSEWKIKPTHPLRVWLSQAQLNAVKKAFQSTHPRRVWRWRWNKFSYVVGISTHTPAKGVTTVKMMILMDTWLISTHTPAKGVTYWNLIMSCPFYFNPHTREGCDRHHSVH